MTREQKFASQKELKGGQGPLNTYTFNEIDIKKLTSDKVLNRHINGPVSIEYDQIVQEASVNQKSS